MIFKKLTLKNFKSYENSEIDFKKGISIIMGDNGAGKSTILEAISFALFKQHTSKKIEELINNNHDNMVVELEFISNGKEYKIYREKPNSGSLKSTLLKKTTANGEFIPICAGDKEVAEEISSILGMDAELFLNAIYIRQGEISDLVDKSPADKKQLIGKLLGIDSLEKAWKNLKPFINNYEKSQAELKGKLSDSDELIEKLDKKKALLHSLKDRGHELETKCDDVKQLKDENHQDKIEMEREKEIYDNFCSNLKSEQEALSILEENKKEIHERLDEIKSSEEKMKRLEKYTKKLPLYLDFEKSVTSIQNLKNDEKTIKNNLKSIEEQKAIVEAEQEGYTNYVTSQEKLDKLKGYKSKIEKEMVGIAQLENDKKDLLNKVEENRTNIESFFLKTKTILADNGMSQELLDSIDSFINLDSETDKFLDSISNKIIKIDEDISAKKEDNVRLKETINSSQKPLKELEEVDGLCPLCQSDISPNKKRELIDYYNYNIEQNKSFIEDNNESIKILESNKENLNKKLDKIKKLSKEIVEYKYLFNDLNKDINNLGQIDEGLEAKKYINDKLSESILNIAKEEARNSEFKDSYEKYNKAKGALDVLDSETETQYKLNQISNDIDSHVRTIQMAIEKDSHLTSNITAEELQERIDDLKEKETEYNQLKGFVKSKKSLEGQLISKKEAIDWKFNKIDSIRNNIEASKYDKDKYDKIIYLSELFEHKYTDYTTELADIKGQAKELITQVNELNGKIVKNQKFKLEYENISEYLLILNRIRDIYGKNGIQKDLRKYSKPLIQKYTNDYFESFNFNYSQLTLDDEFDITLHGPQGESIINMVSGGEKIAIALALRLGITRAISDGDLETIMLDEPTVHLDQARRHELINILKEMNVLPQLIIVTHENELENAADNLIKVEKKNGVSTVEVE